MNVGDIQTQDTINIQKTDRGKMRRSGGEEKQVVIVDSKMRDWINYMYGVIYTIRHELSRQYNPQTVRRPGDLST